MKKLEGKVAVVTGASKGIGAAIAKALGAAGASVVVGYGRDRAGAESTVQAIEVSGSKALAVQADLGKEADVKKLFTMTKRALRQARRPRQQRRRLSLRPDRGRDGRRISLDRWTRTCSVRSSPSARRCRSFRKKARASSTSGRARAELTPPMGTLYIASKAAIDGVTGVLARELGARATSASIRSIPARWRPRAPPTW